MKERIVWLICGAYLVDVLFDLIPAGGPQYSFFPFFHGYGDWDGKMTLQYYVYGYCQHLFLIIMLHAVYVHTGRKYWEWLMWLEVVEVVLYAAYYSHTILRIYSHGIEFNYFKFMAVLYLTHREYGART